MQIIPPPLSTQNFVKTAIDNMSPSGCLGREGADGGVFLTVSRLFLPFFFKGSTSKAPNITQVIPATPPPPTTPIQNTTNTKILGSLGAVVALLAIGIGVRAKIHKKRFYQDVRSRMGSHLVLGKVSLQRTWTMCPTGYWDGSSRPHAYIASAFPH